MAGILPIPDSLLPTLEFVENIASITPKVHKILLVTLNLWEVKLYVYDNL